MARLINSQRHYFELRPVAYQFASGDNKYDLNWLQIRVSADNGEHQWTATDPALLNWELLDLIKWLRTIAANDQESESSWKAIEPSLRFKYRFSSGRRTLEVSLGYDFLPPAFLSDKNYAERVIILFDQIEAGIPKFASALEKELMPFPIRGGNIAS